VTGYDEAPVTRPLDFPEITGGEGQLRHRSPTPRSAAARRTRPAGPPSSVTAGFDNSATGPDSAVSGGATNNASASGSSVVGGDANTANGSDASVAGGFDNRDGDTTSFIGAGCANLTGAGTTDASVCAFVSPAEAILGGAGQQLTTVDSSYPAGP